MRSVNLQFRPGKRTIETGVIVVAVLFGVRPPRLIAGTIGEGTPSPVQVGANVHVSVDRHQFPHDEVTIAADPSDPSRLIAGSMTQSRPGAAPEKSVAYASFDGGKTWNLSRRHEGRPSDAVADPTVAYGPDGSAYFATITWPDASKIGGESLEIARSPDGGKTWGEARVIRVRADRPYIAIDCTGGQYRGRVYCSCKFDPGIGRFRPGLYIARDGRTFDEPRSWEVERPSVVLAMCNGVVLSDGTFALAYSLWAKREDDLKSGLFRVRLSVGLSPDGGETIRGAVASVGDFFWSNRSGVPMLAADVAGTRFQDSLYMVWADARPGATRVLFAASRDKGSTWSDPAIISEQERGKEFETFMPSVAVNREGIVGVSWYDRRGIPE